MSTMLWKAWQEDWLLGEKVEFNGVDKRIYVHPLISALNVKADIYSAWKRWVLLRDNGKFLPALRTIGGDPLVGGQYAGDLYFLQNGWQIVIDHVVTITGILYNDAGGSPFIIEPGGGVTATVSNLALQYNTSGAADPPTVQQIRAELDTNSTKLISIDTAVSNIETNMVSVSNIAPAVWNANTANYVVSGSMGKTLGEVPGQLTTILNAVNNVSVSSAAINAGAAGFTLTSGTVVSGTYLDTRTYDVAEHYIRDNAGAFDIEYQFDIGLSSIPASLTFIGYVADKHEVLNISAWNYNTLTWETVTQVSGANTNKSFTGALYSDHVGFLPGQIGDVRIRMHSTVLSDIFVHVDQLYVSYAKVEKSTGYSGHVVSATSTTLTLANDAVTTDNYYTPALIMVNHGTGAFQYAKAISYTGSTRTLYLEVPMATTLDTTSHITLAPWASADVSTASKEAITTSIWSKVTASGKTTLQWLEGLLSLNKFLGLK